MSPTRTSRAALAGWPLDWILPRSQAREARDRVLKNLAAQSHLSIRTEGMSYFATGMRFWEGVQRKVPPLRTTIRKADRCAPVGMTGLSVGSKRTAKS